MKSLRLFALVASLVVGGAATPLAAEPPVAESGWAGVLLIPWGSGGDMLARVDGNESNPEGPMSFVPLPDGSVWVLDQLSERVVRFAPDGTVAQSVPVEGTAWQDLDVLGERVYLLDRLVRRVVKVVDLRTGASREEGIEGPGIAEGGGVTAMFARPDGVWLEYAHGNLVRVVGADGGPGDRAVSPGRPVSRAGTSGGAELVRARLDRPSHGAVLELVDGAGSVLRSRTVPLGAGLHRIAWVEGDGLGGLVAAFHVSRFSPDGRTLESEHVEGIRLGGNGEIAATFSSPFCIRATEQFRELKLASDGSLWQMAFADDGVVFVQWRKP